jgi:hypothetical protein
MDLYILNSLPSFPHIYQEIVKKMLIEAKNVSRSIYRETADCLKDYEYIHQFRTIGIVRKDHSSFYQGIY